MNRLVQSVILAGFLGFMHAAWQPASAAEPSLQVHNCVGLDCETCETDLNTALSTHSLLRGDTYLFVCGHESGGNLFVGFGYEGAGPNNLVAYYDSLDKSCSVSNDEMVGLPTVTPVMDRPSINAWKKSLREVCRNY